MPALCQMTVVSVLLLLLPGVSAGTSRRVHGTESNAALSSSEPPPDHFPSDGWGCISFTYYVWYVRDSCCCWTISGLKVEMQGEVAAVICREESPAAAENLDNPPLCVGLSGPSRAPSEPTRAAPETLPRAPLLGAPTYTAMPASGCDVDMRGTSDLASTRLHNMFILYITLIEIT